MSSQLSNRFDATSDNKIYCRKISTVHPGINMYHSLPISVTLLCFSEWNSIYNRYKSLTFQRTCWCLYCKIIRVGHLFLICSFFYCMGQTHTHTSWFNSFSGWRRIKKSITKCMKHLGYWLKRACIVCKTPLCRKTPQQAWLINSVGEIKLGSYCS